jgi:hypothetical protein
MTVKAVCVCDIHTGQRGAHSQIFDDEGVDETWRNKACGAGHRRLSWFARW